MRPDSLHKRIILTTACSVAFIINGYANNAYTNSAASDLPQYALSIRLIPNARRLEVTGTMRVPATNSVRETLEFSLSELMQDLRVEVVSPSVSAGAAKLDQELRPYSRPGWGTITWTIDPSHPIPANESVLLRFSYSGGDRTGFIFSLAPDVCFAAGIATAWYPEVEEPLLEKSPRLRGLRGTGTLQFSVPPDFIVHSEGVELAASNKNSHGAFRFEITSPTFFSFAAGKYKVRQESGQPPISLYLLRARANEESYLSGSAKVIDALTREFGPYPHMNFAIIEVPTEQGDRAGFAGASLDGFILANTDFLDKDFNTAYFGHEISHQWWGNLIRSKGLEGRWMLTEGMAQYGSLRTVEMVEGPAAAKRYRRSGYPGYIPDQSAKGYFALVSAGKDHRLSDLPAEGDESRALSDSKGFIVLDMLSREIGRQCFSHILQDIVREQAYQRVSWREFLRRIEKRANRNLQWFYEQWFQRTDAPDYRLSWKQEGRTVLGIITQSAPYFRSTLDVEITGGSRHLVKKIHVYDGRTEFSVTLPFRVRSVMLDPHYKVLRWLPEFRQGK